MTRILDGLGRDVCRVARGGVASATWQVERRAYDVRGNVLSIVDTFGRTAFENAYDLTDRSMRVDSIDAGRRITGAGRRRQPRPDAGRARLSDAAHVRRAGRPAGVYAPGRRQPSR